MWQEQEAFGFSETVLSLSLSAKAFNIVLVFMPDLCHRVYFRQFSMKYFILFYFLFVCLAVLHGLRHLSSLTTEIESVPPAVEARSPNHWTAREFPQ